MHTDTHTHTDKRSNVTLAAHARRGLTTAVHLVTLILYRRMRLQYHDLADHATTLRGKMDCWKHVLAYLSSSVPTNK